MKKYIKTKILCYTKSHKDYAKKLDKLYEEEDNQIKKIESMGFEYKKDKELAEDIELYENCLEEAQEFREGLLFFDSPLLSICEGDEDKRLIVEFVERTFVINETLESFEEKYLAA